MRLRYCVSDKAPYLRRLIWDALSGTLSDKEGAMGTIEARLTRMGYELPPPFVFPKNNRTGCTHADTLLLLSGHGLDLPKLPHVRQTGKFGVDITVEEGYATRGPWPSP